MNKDTVFDRWQGAHGIHYDREFYLITVTLDKRAAITRSGLERFAAWVTLAFDARVDATKSENYHLLAIRCVGHLRRR